MKQITTLAFILFCGLLYSQDLPTNQFGIIEFTKEFTSSTQKSTALHRTKEWMIRNSSGNPIEDEDKTIGVIMGRGSKSISVGKGMSSADGDLKYLLIVKHSDTKIKALLTNIQFKSYTPNPITKTTQIIDIEHFIIKNIDKKGNAELKEKVIRAANGVLANLEKFHSTYDSQYSK